MALSLSKLEESQLGSPYEPGSRWRYPTREEWGRLRYLLVERARKSNPLLDPDLTAYTPGETLQLLDHPKVQGWFKYVSSTSFVQPHHKLVVAVPCAKSKPFAPHPRGTYRGFNKAADEIPDALFITISEPLGCIPRVHWHDFPQYDNPGLFHSDVLRHGIEDTEWGILGFADPLVLPFDDRVADECCRRLGAVIGQCLRLQGLPVVACVASKGGGSNSHSAMMRSSLAAGRYPLSIVAKDRLEPYVNTVAQVRRFRSAWKI